MSYSTLMVYLDLYRPNHARLQVAVDLAEQLDARLIGIAGCLPQPSVYTHAYTPDIVEKIRTEVEGTISSLEQRFRAVVQNRVKDVEWRASLTSPVDFVAREARSVDLVITGANRGGAFIDPMWGLDPSELVMNLGRPMIVVPPEVDRLKLSSVLIGWKDTREARRAVADALPLLKRVSSVAVVEIVADDRDRAAAAGRVSDVAAWLARHQVNVRPIVPPPCGVAAEQLALQASDMAADVVVAGAYGHSRLREWILGGVTNDLITGSTRCAMLSH